LTWEALAKKRIHIWLPSQFEVCKAQMCLKCDHLQFALCWNDLTSGINRLNLNPNSQNWQKRKSWQIRECHQKRRPTVLYTWWIIAYYDNDPHAKNENPLRNNNKMPHVNIVLIFYLGHYCATRPFFFFFFCYYFSSN
jgi:hypothetical protein